MERVVVLEANEIPRRVVDWWMEQHPGSELASLIGAGSFAETMLDEELPRGLYPSQSWASLGTGVPFAEHGIFWYGDPKPAALPFYWQAAADAGRSVGLMGVLHSSPLADQRRNGFVFAVPDVFGADPTTIPARLQPLHQLSLRLSGESARVARLQASPGDLGGVWSMVRNGVRPATWGSLGRLAAEVQTRRWNRERLRVGQSLIAADVFERQIDRHDPDLAVLFVNHVASFMHRYWAASFPEDWPAGSGYDETWVDAHIGELPYAMAALDRIVGRLRRQAERTGRSLIIASSMGQRADLAVDPSVRYQAVVRDPAAFLRSAGIEHDVEVRGAMVPQITIVCDASVADGVADRIASFVSPGSVSTMIAAEGDRRVVTVSYRIRCSATQVELGGQMREAPSLGVTVERVSDHRSGSHCPRGILISSRQESWPAEIDAFEFAPMMLERLGVPALDHHRRPVTT